MLNLVNHVNPVYGPRANRRRTVDRINGISMISARTHHRLLNVARTIADLAGGGEDHETRLPKMA